MWWLFAILSSVFAALTSILAKIGINGVNSNLATAIRTVVVVVMSWGMVFLTNAQTGLGEISRKSWLFLILSGLATGASWLCYYHALQLGEASKVVPINKLSVAITALGYQSCWYEGHITDVDRIGARMAKILGVPDEYDLVCFLPVGRALEAVTPPRKQPFEARTWFNAFPAE